MDFFHCTLDIITRNEGRSAVAAAAYRSGTRLENTWNGTVCDYRRKHAVVYSEIMLPPNAPRAYLDREVLWNSVEWSEKKKNAQLARDMELSLPAELPREEQIKLVRDYVQKTFVDEGMCADFSIHDPDGENPNPHCHLMLTMRPLDEIGQWAQKSRLVYDLDGNGQRIQKKNGEWKTHKENLTNWDDRSNAEKWRAAAAEAINNALRENGFTEGFVDHRSYQRQGKGEIPTMHEGPSAHAMEKRGIQTDIGNQNREIRAWNRQMNQFRARLARLNEWAKTEAKAEAYLRQQGKEQPDPVRVSELVLQLLNKPFKTGVSVRQHQNEALRRLREQSLIRNVCEEYGIVDAQSFAQAVKQANDAFYELRGQIVENERQAAAIRECAAMYDQREKYGKYARKLEKLPAKKHADYEETHRRELTLYQAADRYMRELERDGVPGSRKDWGEALSYCGRQTYLLKHDQDCMKEKIRALELAKREFLQLRERKREEKSRQKSEER